MTRGRLVVLALCLAAAAAGGPRRVAALRAQQPELLYVCIQDDAKVAVVDMDAQTVLRTVDLVALGFPATAKPHFVVVEPDARHWYVSLIGANRVVKFDRTDRIVGQFEMETPGMLALYGPDTLVVTRSMSAVNPPPRVAIVNRTTMTGDEVDVIFPRPHPIVASKAGYAYTASLGMNRMASIALPSQRVAVFPVPPGRPTPDAVPGTHAFVQFALSPDGRTMVGSTEVSGQLVVFTLATPVNPIPLKQIPVGTMAFDPAYSPDGAQVYVPVKSTNEIVVVDTATWTVKTRLKDPAFQQPHQVVFSRDGATAFVTNNRKMDHMADPAHADHAMPAATDGAASLVVLDTKTGRVVKTIELGRNLTGMGTRSRG